MEFSPKEIEILKEECERCNVKFMSTPFDEPSLELLCDIGVDLIKVASFDIGNLPFLEKIAKTKLPVVISTGGANQKQIKDSIDLICGTHNDLAVLHCVSEYPCPPEKLRLLNITYLEKNIKNITLGLTDHFNGNST